MFDSKRPSARGCCDSGVKPDGGVYRLNRAGPFSYRGSNSFHRAVTDVASGEDSRNAGFER